MSEQDQSIRGYIPVQGIPETEAIRAIRQQKFMEAMIAFVVLLIAIGMVFTGVTIKWGVGPALAVSGTMVFIVGLFMSQNT